MSFVFPGFLVAFAALAVPILIHLFNFRRFKKVFFTNVRFLKEIKQDTRSRSRLKHLLILISRLLAVSFLVLAFAQPYLPSANHIIRGESRVVSVFVDNSFSMDAVGSNGRLFDQAKTRAREIAEAYKPSDRFQLLTNDFEGKQQYLVNREEFLRELDGITLSPATRHLSEVITRQTDAMSNTGNATRFCYILSDFQKSFTDPGNIHTDSNEFIRLIPLQSNLRQNLYIDTAFITVPYVMPGAPVDVIVKVRNDGTEEAENIPLKLTINGIQKGLSSLTISGNSSSESKLSFTLTDPGWQSAEVSISDFPITFDDTYFLSFHIRTGIQILSIENQNSQPYFGALFGKDPYFTFKSVPVLQVPYSVFPSQQLIILDEPDQLSSGLIQELKNYVSKGGALFIIPSGNADLLSYNELLGSLHCNTLNPKVESNEKVEVIESGNSLFNGVFEPGKPLPENIDLPVVNKYYPISKNTFSSEEVLLKLQSGHTFLSVTSFDQGKVYLLASPVDPEYSNFARHALFVPVFLKAALQGASSLQAPLVIGRDQDFSFTDTVIAGDNIFHLENKGLNFDIIPETRVINDHAVLSVHNQVTQPGNYLLKANGKVHAVVSFNYDRSESQLSCYNAGEISELLATGQHDHIAVINGTDKAIGHSIASMNEGTSLWKYCIIIALLFLAVEVLLVRFLK